MKSDQSRSFHWAHVLFLPGMMGGLLVAFLRYSWTADPQYAFGWVVPLLMLYLIFRKSTGEERIAPGETLRGAAWLSIALMPIFLAMWFVAQANLDWRLAGWVLGGLFVLSGWSAAAALGGWRWAVHFGLPVGLILFAVPWPSAIETLVTDSLMKGVAILTVEGLNIAGIPAIQRGNLIEVGAGVLGIDQACSGVRSLNATLMTSVFLGELFALGRSRRFALVGIGLGVAFALNVVRTFALSVFAARDGVAAVDRWHDPAGWSIFAVSFIIVAAIAAYFEKKKPVDSLHAQEEAVQTSASPVQHFVVIAIRLAAVVMLVAVAGIEMWYRSNAPGEEVPWTAQPDAGAKEMEIPEISREMLGFDEGGMWSGWTGAAEPMVVAYLRWDAGVGNQQVLSRLHRPDVCLPAAGWQLEKDLGQVRINVQSLELSFSAYRFEIPGEWVYVFQTFRENVPASRAAKSSINAGWRGRLASALDAKRGIGHQTLQFAIWTGANEADVLERFPTVVAEVLEF